MLTGGTLLTPWRSQMQATSFLSSDSFNDVFSVGQLAFALPVISISSSSAILGGRGNSKNQRNEIDQDSQSY